VVQSIDNNSDNTFNCSTDRKQEAKLSLEPRIADYYLAADYLVISDCCIAVFEMLGPKRIGVMTLIFPGLVTSSVV